MDGEDNEHFSCTTICPKQCEMNSLVSFLKFLDHASFKLNILANRFLE